MNSFLLFSFIVAAYCCSNFKSCTDCTGNKCQYALLNSGDILCTKKIKTSTFADIVSIAKLPSHCQNVDRITSAVSTITTASPKNAAFNPQKSNQSEFSKPDNADGNNGNNTWRMFFPSQNNAATTSTSSTTAAAPTKISNTFTTTTTETSTTLSTTPTATTSTTTTTSTAKPPAPPPTFIITRLSNAVEKAETTNITKTATFSVSNPQDGPPPPQKECSFSSPPAIQHPFFLFSDKRMFSLVHSNATCADMVPEFRYMRTLCTLNRTARIYNEHIPEDVKSLLGLNPAKHLHTECIILETLRNCKVIVPPHSKNHFPSFPESSEMFNGIAGTTNCTHKETPKEHVVRLLCRMEQTAVTINWFDYSVLDFGFYSLNPAKFYDTLCTTLLHHRRHCA